MTSDSLTLANGDRLRSQVCGTEVIVLRAPSEPVALCCGGASMVPLGSPNEARIDGPAPDEGDGSLLGKRYISESVSELELLVTKGGTGALSIEGEPLAIKESKALPSSD